MIASPRSLCRSTYTGAAPEAGGDIRQALWPAVFAPEKRPLSEGDRRTASRRCRLRLPAAPGQQAVHAGWEFPFTSLVFDALSYEPSCEPFPHV